MTDPVAPRGESPAARPRTHHARRPWPLWTAVRCELIDLDGFNDDGTPRRPASPLAAPWRLVEPAAIASTPASAEEGGRA